MKKRFWLCLIILSVLFIGCNNPTDTVDIVEVDIVETEHFTVRLPTIEEEAQLLISWINTYNTFYSQIPNISLPNYPIVKSLYQKVSTGGVIDSSDITELENFLASIYDPSSYQSAMRVFNGVIKIVEQQFGVFKRYQEKWQFYIPDNNRFTFILCKYYSRTISGFAHIGGNEIIRNKISIGTSIATKDTRGDLLHVLFHEIFHIGYMNSPNTVILPSGQNERLTERFVIDHFSKLTGKTQSNYVNPDTSLDGLFEYQDKQDFWDNLLERIKEFLQKN